MNNEEPILPQIENKTLMISADLPSQESFQELQQAFDKPKLTIRDILSKTWDELDKQQVFDQIAEHLLTQSRKSFRYSDNDTHRPKCSYRGANETKCAVGILIPDGEYNPCMESKAVRSLAEEFYCPVPLDRAVTDFLQVFQGIHDSYEVGSWKRVLSTVPDNRRGYSELNTDILEQFTWNEGEQRYVRQQ